MRGASPKTSCRMCATDARYSSVTRSRGVASSHARRGSANGGHRAIIGGMDEVGEPFQVFAADPVDTARNRIPEDLRPIQREVYWADVDARTGKPAGTAVER